MKRYLIRNVPISWSFYSRIFWFCLCFGLHVFWIRGCLFLWFPCCCLSAAHIHIISYSKWPLVLTWIPLNLLPILLAISLTLKKHNLTKSVGTFFWCALVRHNRALINQEPLVSTQCRLFTKNCISPGKKVIFHHSGTATFNFHPLRQIL